MVGGVEPRAWREMGEEEGRLRGSSCGVDWDESLTCPVLTGSGVTHSLSLSSPGCHAAALECE